MKMSELWAEREIVPVEGDRTMPKKYEPGNELTLRDHFAMAALPHFIGQSKADDDHTSAAIMAYIYADAMMEERQWMPESEEGEE
jgi:hypothetical protein